MMRRYLAAALVAIMVGQSGAALAQIMGQPQFDPNDFVRDILNNTVSLLYPTRTSANCTAETGGVSRELCIQTDQKVYVCTPSAGDCDTAIEWPLLNAQATICNSLGECTLVSPGSQVLGDTSGTFDVVGAGTGDHVAAVYAHPSGLGGGLYEYRFPTNSVDPNKVRLGCKVAGCGTQIRVGANLLAAECFDDRSCAFGGDTLVVDPSTGSVSVNGSDVCTASGENCPTVTGDMLKTTYDQDANGVVDDSEQTDAVKVGALDCSSKPAGFVRVVAGVPTLCVPSS